MESREFSAKTVDEAITKACIEMELSSDQLDITVVSEGSSGFLGFGSKPAVIRVSKKAEPVETPVEPAAETEPAPAAPEKPETPEEPSPAEKRFQEAAPEKEDAPESAKPEPAEEKPYSRPEKNAERSERPSYPKKEVEKVERTEEEISAAEEKTRTFLDNIFKAMDLPVEIVMKYDSEYDAVEVNLEGEDMGILIGKRGQTLDSLQYLTSLAVNKGREHFIRVKLDTENYRERRKETLENLARNIARKVRKTRRPVSLEPMNPYERRIIHSCLQDNRYVETYSEGNEPYRHVVITLKNQYR